MDRKAELKTTAQKKWKIFNKVFEKYNNGNMPKYEWCRFEEEEVVIKKDSVWLNDLMRDEKGPFKHIIIPGETHNMPIEGN